MTAEIIALISGLFLGGIVAWFWARSRAREGEGMISELRSQVQLRENEIVQLRAGLDSERTTRVSVETRWEEARRNLEEQKALLDEATKKLTDTFNALAGEALKSSNQVFMDLAKKTLERVLEEAKGDLGQRQEAIAGLMKPLQESLRRYETQIRELENTRQQAYGGLQEHLDSLKKETAVLASVLKTPQKAGRWGEITLRRVVEAAGMSRYCDFVEQHLVGDGEGRKRPDLVVRLPAEGTVVVDAKAPLSAYMEAVGTDEEEKRKAALARHAQSVREHMKSLSSKAYWSQFPSSPDFVVMFLPGESFFIAALEQDQALMEDGFSSRVILATPTTLISLLKTVALTWQQQQVAENSRKIWEAGSDLFDRVAKFTEHLARVREGLSKSTQAFNDAVGSWERRVVPGARKLKELGATEPGREMSELGPVDTSLREPPKMEEKE